MKAHIAAHNRNSTTRNMKAHIAAHNRNSTTRNMKAHIAAHNGKILSKKEEISEGCNCRENGDPCHHQGEQPNKQNLPWNDRGYL